MTTATRADRIDALLPQTQCTRCGYPGCRPYAEAIAAGAAEINRCPPGGQAGVRALAELLGRAELELDPECGVHAPLHLAWIREDECIGCLKCVQACPVDAIVGASKHIHTVIAERCTGCELCLPPCPVECIRMEAVGENLDNWKWKYPIVEIKATPPSARDAATAGSAGIKEAA